MRCFGLSAVLFPCLLLTGCSGGGGTAKATAAQRTEDPLAVAREQYRNGTEAPHFRGANSIVSTYLADKPDALQKLYPGTEDKAHLQAILRKQPGLDVDKLDDRALYQRFLATEVGLDQAEIDEVENGSFRLLDGAYLESCYLFREIARSMPLQGLPPLEQAEFCFHWVMRQVVLQPGRDELLPPQYVLQRGQGSAAERAVVFISLLQQLTPQSETPAPHLDACLIALPEKDGLPRPWLVGVLIENKGGRDVYLFDPRLGVPVPEPKGKGIATLAQLRAKPEAVLAAFNLKGDTVKYDVDAAQAKKAEIFLVCPMSALSARMRFLEDEVVLGRDRINLAVRAAELVEKFGKLKNSPAVRIWNVPPPKPGVYPQTPTRTLRLFLPVEEGGIDKSNRLELFQRDLAPAAAIEQGFFEEKLALADLQSTKAYDQLWRLAYRAWTLYGVVPAQQLIRGRLEDCTKRLDSIQKALGEITGKSVNADAIAKWRARVQAAYVAKDQSKQAEIWTENQWLHQFLTSPDDDLAGAKEFRKGLLSDMVLWALSEPMRGQASYLLALRWQEKAERLQARADHLAASAGSEAEKAKAKKAALEAWQSADAMWNVSGHENPLTAETIRVRVEIVKQHVQGNRLQLAAGLRDHYQWLVRQATAARFMHARALEKTGNSDAAVGMLKRVAEELDTLDKAGTLGAPGAFLWQRYAVALKLNALKGKAK